jgi:hypothetical protein
MAMLRIGLLYWLLTRGLLLLAKLRTNFDGESLSAAGTSCTYSVSRGRHRQIMHIRVGIAMDPLFCFMIRRESVLDRVAGVLHIAREWQTADTQFNESIYVLSDDPTLLRALSGDEKLRSLVMRLLSDSKIQSLRCNAGTLWIEHSGSGIDREQENEDAALEVAQPVVSTLCEIKDHLIATHATLWNSERDRGVERERVMFGVIGALAVGGVLGYITAEYWSRGAAPRLLVFDETQALALQVCVLAVVGLCAATFWLLGRTARLHLVLAEILLTAAPAIWFAALGTLAVYDIKADAGQGEERLVHIDRTYVVQGRRNSRTYYLVVTDWPDSRIDATLEVPSAFYRQVAAGDCLRLDFHRGRFGDPWTGALEPQSRCSATAGSSGAGADGG